MPKFPRPSVSTIFDLFILAGVLALLCYDSQFYLSQQVDDSLDITVMSEFPRLVASHFTTNLWFYPFSVDLQSTFGFSVLPSLIGDSLRPLLGDWVLTQRAVAVVLVLATAVAMYFVARRLIRDRYGALFAAVAYAYSDTFLMRMPSHLPLLGGFVFPLLLYTLHSKRRILSGLVLGIAYWSSPEFGLMGLLLAGSYLAYEVLDQRMVTRELVSRYVISGLVFFAMVFYLVPSSLLASAGTTNEPLNLIWRNQFALIAPGPPIGAWEQNTAYLGIVTVATAATVLLFKRDKFNLYLLSVALLFVFFSAVFIPYWPFSSIRVPGRFSVVAVFSLSLLGGQLFTLRPVHAPGLRRPLAVFLLILLVADNAVAPPPWFSEQAPFQWANPGYQIIRNDPNATAQVDFPIMPTGTGIVYYQYETVLTGKAVVDGQTTGLGSVGVSDAFDYNLPFLRNFIVANNTNKFELSYSGDAFATNPTSYDFWLLRGWGITYIVLHKVLYRPVGGTDRAMEFLSGLGALGWVSMVYDDESIAIYRITIGIANSTAAGIASPAVVAQLHGETPPLAASWGALGLAVLELNPTTPRRRLMPATASG